MPVRKMAETLADQNLNPPFDKDQDGRLRSKVNEGSGSIDELEGDVKRHAHLARAAHQKLKALGYNVGRLTGARSWAPDRNSTGTGEGVDALSGTGRVPVGGPRPRPRQPAHIIPESFQLLVGRPRQVRVPLDITLQLINRPAPLINFGP